MPNNLENPQVQSGTVGGAATPAAPSTPVEPVAPATPSTPLADAEAQNVAALKAQLSKYESDIRALKSASDKRQSELETRYRQEQETLRKELQALRMASMDDDERKTYEASLATERQQTIEQELAQARQAAAENQATMQALSYFLQNGVPADELKLDQGYDQLFNSGMTWLTNQIKQVKQSVSQQSSSSQQPSTSLPNPPVVATGNGVPATKPTWTDLRAKFGDDETIYRMVEAGQLPVDIIPG